MLGPSSSTPGPQVLWGGSGFLGSQGTRMSRYGSTRVWRVPEVLLSSTGLLEIRSMCSTLETCRSLRLTKGCRYMWIYRENEAHGVVLVVLLTGSGLLV